MSYSQRDDLKYNESLKKSIAKLKKKHNAVIIAHNYQRDEIQEIADISGDSLALSQAAVRTDADIIVFCGVHFMAESAAILNPSKKVLLPVKEAGCPMADMITPEKLRAKRKMFPEAAIVCYVNSSAAVKAESDIACTSSNAVEIVKSLKEKQIIFVPDKNLGRYVQSQVPDKEIILWEGFCPTHIRVQEEDIVKAKTLHPEAVVIAHPECNPEVLALADHICSTHGMFTYSKKSDRKEFIIATECGMLYKLHKENPDKKFYVPTDNLLCANMKLITLGWVAHALEMMVYEVKVPEDVRDKARITLEKMLAVTGEKKGAAIAGY
jgi:quinolinate synthase